MIATQMTEDQRDCLQEISNIAMGQAGDSLARFLEVFVHLSIPLIRLIDTIELPSLIKDFDRENELVSAVRQGFYDAMTKSNFNGEAVVIFNKSSQSELGKLMNYPNDLSEIEKQEVLLDITNILCGACLNGIAEQINAELSFSPPSIVGQNLHIDQAIKPSELNWQHALVIEFSYTFEKHSFNCDMILLMPDESINNLIKIVDDILEDL